MARRSRRHEDTHTGNLFDLLPEGGVLIISAQPLKPPPAAPAPAESSPSPASASGTHDPFKLTEDQSKALDLTHNRLISASAGTGKTHTVTALYLALLEGRLEPGGKLLSETDWLERARAGKLQPMRPGEIVAVTFTEKAASELLERTREGLEYELTRAGLPETLRQHLTSCRKELFSAPVSTIHAFCARLLREAGAEGPAPAAFTVLEQEEARELLDVALSEAAAEMLSPGTNSCFQAIAQEYPVFNRRVGLREIGRALLNALRTRGLIPDALRSRNAMQLEEVVVEFEHFYDTVAAVPDSGRSKPAPELRVLCAARRFPQTLKEARLLALEMQPYLGLKWAETAGLSDAFVWVLHAAHAPFVDALAEYATLARRKYAEAKRKAGGVDYDDLLLTCRELLRSGEQQTAAGKPPLQMGRYRFVLIDEYQDTNPLQQSILFGLVFPDGSLDGPARMGLVGDMKQSIYRFRGADVTLMEEAERQFVPTPLRENFRSRKKLIDFFNAFFAFAWPEHTDRLHYDDTHKLQSGWAGERHAWDGPAGEVICWEKEKERPGADEHRLRQAFITARRIRTLVEPAERASLPRPVVWDKTTGGPRKEIRYGDIAILSRSLKHMRTALQLALSSLRIPFRMLGGVSFFTRQEIIDVTNLWAVVCDPGDSYALAGLLRSPFVGLSDPGLWHVTEAAGLTPDGGAGAFATPRALAEVVLAGPNEKQASKLSAEDAEAWERGARVLKRLQEWRGRRTAFEILDWALAESGFLSVQALQPRGEVAVAAVRKLIEIARGFEARGNKHLSDLVRWLRERADAEWEDPGNSGAPELPADMPADEDSVQIGTIHSAKGLEFPIVILVEAGAPSPPASGWALFSSENGLGLRLGSALDGLSSAADSAHQANAKKEKREEDAERLRLLYVALTRARDYLIIMGETSRAGETNWRKLIDDFRTTNPDALLTVDAKDEQLRAASAGAERGLLVFKNGIAEVRKEFAQQLKGASIEAAPTPKPAPILSHELRVSVSRLALWAWCPRRAAFAAWENNIDALKSNLRDGASPQDAEQAATGESDDGETNSESPDARMLGIALHAALEALFGADDAGSPESQKRAEQCFERELGSLSGAAKRAADEVFGRALALARSEWGRSIAALAPADRRTEAPFRWRMPAAGGGRVTLVGQVDLIAKTEPDRWQVVDFKLATAVDKTREDESIARYAWQAALYARVAAEILKAQPEKVSAALLFMRDEPLVPRTLDSMGHGPITEGTLAKVAAQFAETSCGTNPLALPAQVWFPSEAGPQPRNAEMCRAQECPYVKCCWK